jgi:hypothetical protein
MKIIKLFFGFCYILIATILNLAAKILISIGLLLIEKDEVKE